jgi:hypothetical protein
VFIKWSSNCFRYVVDMGALRLRTITNTGMRKEPPIDSRVAEYKQFLSSGGIIIGNERIIVCVKGGGLALVTSLPEVLLKKCQRMGVPFKRGEVTIVVDMLKKVDAIAGVQDNRPEGTVDYIRNHSGIKMLARTILLSNIVLPLLRPEMRRTSIIKCEVLSPAERVDGLDVHRLQSNEVEMLFERETELFNVLE